MKQFWICVYVLSFQWDCWVCQTRHRVIWICPSTVMCSMHNAQCIAQMLGRWWKSSKKYELRYWSVTWATNERIVHIHYLFWVLKMSIRYVRIVKILFEKKKPRENVENLLFDWRLELSNTIDENFNEKSNDLVNVEHVLHLTIAVVWADNCKKKKIK